MAVGPTGANTSQKGGIRGQTGTLGVVFVFAIAILGAGVILLFVGGQLSAGQQSLSEQRAEKSMTQFDSKAALVALGNTDTQTVRFAQNSDADFEVNEGTGWMRITIDNRSDGGNEKVLINQTLGSVVYENERSVVAYQGGGVWRTETNSENTIMVSPPEFHFRNGTLTLPVVNVTGDDSLSGDATVTHKKTTKSFPNATADPEFTNPLTDHVVKVTVQSRYYRGWGGYFEERTDGKVDYDHDRNIVNLTLVSPLDKDTITSATASLSASGDFIITGSSAQACSGSDKRKNYTDSYDSDVDAYCDQPWETNGDVVYGGDVDIDQGSGTSYINGNIEAGETVTVSGSNGAGQPRVRGNINYTVSCTASGGPPSNDCSDRIDPPSAGTVNQIDGIDSSPRINSVVNRTVYDLKDSNDNGGAPISSNTLDFSAGPSSDEVNLTAGQYYLESIDLSSDEKVNLNTTDGNITLAVRGDVDMPSDAEIAVTGENDVKLYVGGESSFSDSDGWTFDMQSGTDVTVPSDAAPQFRVYGKDDFRLRLDTGDDHGFVGAIFAPPGSSGTGEVLIESGHIWGGVLTGTTEISNKGAIHYDEALEDKKVLSRNAAVVKVTYLHVSLNEIKVTDD